jgi:hypothetical protein
MKKISEFLCEGASGKTRYSTELGVLSHFLGGIDIKSPEDILDENFWGDTSKFSGGWDTLKKRLDLITKDGKPEIDVSLFNVFRRRGAELSNVMKDGDNPTEFSWAGGQNKSADSDPSDVSFTSGSEYSGVSIKASASSTLTNLTAKEVDKNIEDGGASSDDENSEEIIDALEDNLPKEFSKENSDIFIKTAPSEFKILWNSIVADYLQEIKEDNVIYGFSRGDGEKKDSFKQEKIEEGQKKSKIIKYGIFKRDNQYYVVVGFNIDENPTKEENFYSYNIKSKYFRPFGNYFVQNASKFKNERDAFFNKIKDSLKPQFEKLLETKENVFRFLNISKKSYYYLTDKKIFLVKKQADFGENISVKICSNKAEDNTGIQYNVVIYSDGTPKASFTFYLRYANGVFVASPTIRIQKPKGFTSFCWEVLSGSERTKMSQCKESTINEGGNVSVRLGDEIHTADKIDLNKLSRGEITAKIAEMLNTINDNYEKKFGTPIWKNREYLNSHMVFNGSSNAFFDKSISDEEFKKYKPLVGDIDLSVPDVHSEQLFDFLQDYRGKEISKGVQYIGMNKESAGNNAQFNCLFLLKDFNVKVQIDFELVSYDHKTGMQTDFSSFAHSSVWSDTVMGYENKIKGVSHKLLIINMVRALSIRPDIVLLTDASPEPEDPSEDDKMKFSSSSKAKGRLSMLAFSVDRGMRVKYRQIFYKNGDPVMHDGKYVFKEEKTSNSVYSKNLEEIYELLFKEKPTSADLTLFRSFYGCLTLLKRYNIDKKIIMTMTEIMIKESLWGLNPKSQVLGLSSREEDEGIKMGIINAIIKYFPYVKKIAEDSQALRDEYYSKVTLDRRI